MSRFCIVLFLCSFTFADIIWVPGEQPSIQAGIDAAADGDTVLVSDSTYVENINFNGKAIMVASYFMLDDDTSHIYNTIINGSQPSNFDSASVVYFISGEDTNSVLCGFTITGGGGGTMGFGGGIFSNWSNPKLTHLRIIYNAVIVAGGGSAGGGVYLGYCSEPPILMNVEIRWNHSVNDGSGGGIDAQCNPILFNVTIRDNSAGGDYSGYGGGLSGEATLINSMIRDNGVYGMISAGGAVYGSIDAMNTIIWGNNGGTMGQAITNSGTIVYSNIQGNGVWPGEGNINENPLWETDSLSNASLCIGAGVDAYQFNGEWFYAPPKDINGRSRPSPSGSNPDMGVWESLLGNPVAINPQRISGVANTYMLHQNYPNPFNPSTTIRYDLPKAAFVTLKVYDTLGREVATLVNERRAAESYRVRFDAGQLAGGLYFYKLNAGSFMQTKKMLLIR